MKTPTQIHAAAIRDIALATVVASFVVLAMIAAFVAADRHLENECRVQQEYRPCR